MPERREKAGAADLSTILTLALPTWCDARMLRWILIACLLLVGSSPTAFATATSKRELVVLILVDAMRPDHTSAYGYQRATTPNLEQLAREGVRYTTVYSNAPWTRPSTVSFLTGLNASRHRTETASSKLPAGIVTLAERMKTAGWTTSAFVANGNGGSLAGLERGFDIFEDPTNTYTKAKRGKTYNGLPTAQFIVDKALAHLAKSRAQREMMFLFFVDPHDPYGAPPQLEKMFLGNFKGTIRRHALWEINNDYPDDERFSMQAIYDAGIRNADNALGTFVAGLKKMGLFKPATIIVSADHGEGFGEHGFYLHAHHFWDEVIRIPLIVHGPRFLPQVDVRLTQPIDVARTIVELGGGNVGEMPGRSLLEAPAPSADVISEYNEFGIHRQAITDGRYKVIWQRPADAAWFDREVKKREYFPSVSFDKEVVHVFDLKSDPAEKTNLAAAMPKTAAALLSKLKEFVGESGRLAASP